MFFTGTEREVEQGNKEDKENQKGDDRVNFYPGNGLHMVFDEF
jgi:hypothetical protein